MLRFVFGQQTIRQNHRHDGVLNELSPGIAGIKAFFGTSENAVKSQIWIAVSTYVLIAILKKRLAIDASLYTLLQVLSLTLFERTPINQLLTYRAHDSKNSADGN